MQRRVISLELNELCPELLDRWTADGTLPNFKLLFEGSDVFQTQADVTTADKLEPWIQWYSIHTGLAYDQHGVFHLSDGLRATHQDIWRNVIEAGGSAFSFASMNVRPFAAPGSLYVADPWIESDNAFPADLNIYNRFVGHHVREHTNPTGLSPSEYADFLRFLLTHGLSAQTSWRTLRQLTMERLRSHLSYQRVAILDALQYDVFAHYYRVMKPNFASFFLNSVAHLQHSYWRHMEPDAFSIRPNHEELARYGGAIRFGYQALDRLIGRFLQLADRYGAILVFQSALSQQPFTRHENRGGQHFHRLHDVHSFLQGCGIDVRFVTPTMTHEYMLTFDSELERDFARARLESFRIRDSSVFDFPAHQTQNALYFGAAISWPADPAEAIFDATTGATLQLKDMFYRLGATKSGCHHPVGSLWIRTGTHQSHKKLVSILDIFPTFLDLLGMSNLRQEQRGTSLVANLSEQQLAA